MAERTPELPQLSVERVRGIVHYILQLSCHPPLCHHLHPVQFHPNHRPGFPNHFVQLDGTTALNAISPAHCCKEYDIGYHGLVVLHL